MAAAVNVRVEARRLPPNASWEEKQREMYNLFTKFKRVCHEANILHMIKMKEFYIRPGDRRRMKESKRLLAIKRGSQESLVKKD